MLGCMSTAAHASEKINVKISFSPYKLGAGTTVVSNVNITEPDGGVPSPAVKLELHYPDSLSLSSSNLGLAICQPAALASQGEEGCPSNSRVGLGFASVAVPFGPEIATETATIDAYMGPPENENVTLLLYAEGRSPVFAQVLMHGALIAGSGPFTELLLKNELPLVASLPGARDVAVTNMVTTFGPRGLLYHKRVGGKLVSYQPRGVILPSTCPAGGFHFSFTTTFQDGSVVTVAPVIPCPHQSRKA
jgi:hypothetical protein